MRLRTFYCIGWVKGNRRQVRNLSYGLAIQHREIPDILFGHGAADLAGAPELPHRLVEAHHAIVAMRHQVVVDALQLSVADRAGDGMRVPEHFQGQMPLVIMRYPPA